MVKKIDYSKVYSPYRLNMFSQCPKQYHFYYIDPEYRKHKYLLKEQPENIWSFQTLGKAVHNAITLFYHSPIEERIENQLLEHLKQTWRSESFPQKEPPLGELGGFESIEKEREHYKEAASMLKNFLKMMEVVPQIEYLPTSNFENSIEDFNNTITPLNDDYDIGGKFDLIIRDGNGLLHVIDFKTGKEEETNTLQLKFYKLLTESRFGKTVERASFYFLKSGLKRTLDLENEDMEDFRREVLEKIEKIQSTEDFKTKPSQLCGFCLFRKVCPDKEKVKEFTKDASKDNIPDELPF